MATQPTPLTIDPSAPVAISTGGPHQRSATPTSASPGRPSPPSGSPASSSSKLQGQRIGPYSLGKTLGVGSTGRVKLGTHIETNHRVAIKIIPKDSLAASPSSSSKPVTTAGGKTEGATTTSLNRKLEREITIMKLIQHPNVLQLYDVYETDKELFLILEHVEGGELFDYLVKKGRLSESEALTFFQQIMLGIDFCHRHLICHRDLKPENLLLDKDLNVKIADFGMASLQVTGKMLETSCGSPHYASPEIIKGVKYDGPSADIWSCGVILYALLTGNLPFDDENIRRLLSKVKSGMYFIPDHVSPDAKDLIKRMLVVDPARRITPPKNGEKHYPTPEHTVKMTRPIEDPSLIDPEIVESLAWIGWGNEAELKEALLASEPNMEKVFYNLLLSRKWDFFEHYDIRRLNEWDVEGGPRRRADSYSNLYPGGSSASGSRFDLFRSEMSLAGGSGAEWRRSTDELRRSTDELRKSQEELRRDRRKSVEELREGMGGNGGERRGVSPVRPKILTAVTNAAVRVNSPLSSSTTFFEDELPRSNPSLNTLPDSEPRTRTPSASSSSTAPTRLRAPSPSPASIKEDMRKKLTISIPVTGGEQVQSQVPPGAMTPLEAGTPKGAGPPAAGMGTPKFHRRKQEIPPTPIITSSPKKSWFANLFNFRPEVFTLSSARGYDETVRGVVDRMDACDVKYQSRKEGGFKCKYDGSPASTATSATPTTSSPLSASSQESSQQVKSVKFKIDIVPDEAVEGKEGLSDVKWKIVFVQQQGAFSTFQMVVDKIKAAWDLDTVSN
ncbi:Serine/threonine-protein kinase brsk1 [Borealophlyctis nickersoniae]|nr:Serine/threonine-protein kinase brsk1 [Borealophlyctis nickersoniae]